ncbi:MAG: hypothetical protein ACYDA6_10185 [Solirubrobacteraceae bacterium]
MALGPEHDAGLADSAHDGRTDATFTLVPATGAATGGGIVQG